MAIRKSKPETATRAAARAIVERAFDVANISTRENLLRGIDETEPVTAWLLEALNEVDDFASERAVLLLVARRLRELFTAKHVFRGIVPDEDAVAAAAKELEDLATVSGMLVSDNDVIAGMAAQVEERIGAGLVPASSRPATIEEVSRTSAGVVDAMVVRIENVEPLELFVLVAGGESDPMRRVYRNIAETRNAVGDAHRVARDQGFVINGESVLIGPMRTQPLGSFAPYRLGNLHLVVGRRVARNSSRAT